MHRLTEIDIKTRTAVCVICGKVRIQSGGKRQKWRCIEKAKELRKKQRQYNKPHRKFFQHWSLERLLCQRCGFQPIHKCQIDVHHKDHNHKNNNPHNLELLCANCHRLEHCSSLM